MFCPDEAGFFWSYGMKKLIVLAALALTLSVQAADVTITTGAQGLTYNGVYGPNLAAALSEFGN